MKIISNCFTLESIPYDGRQLYQGIDRGQNYIELDNGVLLKSMNDGRFYDKEENRWVEVYDWDEENDCGYSLGYVEV